jgi:hypothetical protein
MFLLGILYILFVPLASALWLSSSRPKQARFASRSLTPVQERKQKEQENAMRADALLRGNPLVQPSGSSSANVKRRWDDDVVFRNMARDEPAEKKRFINDTIRSDFHKRFLKRYVQ